MDGWLKGKKRQKRYKDAQGRKKEKMDKENGKKTMSIRVLLAVIPTS